MSLIGSGVLSRAVSDGIFSKKRVSQAGLQKAFAFSANRYYSKQRDLLEKLDRLVFRHKMFKNKEAPLSSADLITHLQCFPWAHSALAMLGI